MSENKLKKAGELSIEQFVSEVEANYQKEHAEEIKWLKRKDDVKKKIEEIEKTYEGNEIPEFMRGVYSALKWVLKEDESK